jgi:predicted PurR-regulated permease PerM
MADVSKPLPRWVWPVATILVISLFVYAVRDILLPFVAGMAVAYLLDPLADKLEARKVPRWAGTIIVLVLFFGGLILLLFGAAPILVSQLSGIAASLPGYIDQLRPMLMRLIDQAGGAGEVKSIASQASGQVTSYLSNWVAEVIKGALHFFNLLGLLLITPVVAFYMLRDWDKMVALIDSWLPRSSEPIIKRLLTESDRALSGFVRGQTMVCVGVGIIYALGWGLMGLNYGLILGLITGMLAFIPYVGQFFGLCVALIVALTQYGLDSPIMIGLVLLVYLIAQLIESNVMTPKLVGDQVGLHAVWVIFAVMAGGSLMGFVGVLLALPVAAVIAVVGRYGLERYLASRYYQA